MSALLGKLAASPALQQKLAPTGAIAGQPGGASPGTGGSAGPPQTAAVIFNNPGQRQAYETQRMLDEAKQKDAQKKLDEGNVREQAALGAQKALTSRPTKGGTLLTGPLGITGGGSGPRKTLLGL